MPKRIPVSDDLLAWLESAVDAGQTYKDMAAHAGCCVDTLKRILQRNGICDFDGAKYQVPWEAHIEMWSRPCSICKDTTPRPKWNYRCDRCHEREADAASLPDNWL